MSFGWDERLSWTFGLIADSLAERRRAHETLVQTRRRWEQAWYRYNQVWNTPDHPEYRERLDAFGRARDFTFPHALWQGPAGPWWSWPGLPYAMLYLRWEARYPDEWLAFGSNWGTKAGILRDLAWSARRLPPLPAIASQLEDLVVMAVRREYRCEDVGYARLARTIASPGLRAKLTATAQDATGIGRTHANYLLWLLDHPDVPRPKVSQWRAWLAAMPQAQGQGTVRSDLDVP